jgi:hypothetical protein
MGNESTEDDGRDLTSMLLDQDGCGGVGPESSLGAHRALRPLDAWRMNDDLRRTEAMSSGAPPRPPGLHRSLSQRGQVLQRRKEAKGGHGNGLPEARDRVQSESGGVAASSPS